MDKYETTAKYNIAETCAASISIEDLCSFDEERRSPLSLSTKLTYGAIRGSEKLRSNLARLYSSKAPSPLPLENILITNGAIAANFLVLYTLVGPGDHVICHYPTYQQLYSVPKSLGADVSLWKAREGRGWQLDVDELKTLIKPNTKLIIIKYGTLPFSGASPLDIRCSNPNNPTGAIIPRSVMEQIVDVAMEHDLHVLSDEVYRPLFHSISPMDKDFPPSILSLAYPKAIATGSLSKAYALAGIRTGWIASRSKEVIESCANARDYTTISVSQIDDQIATFALDPSCVHGLLGRNIKLAKTNLDILAKFVEEHRALCNWIKPVAGTTAFIKFSREGEAVDDVEFCKILQETTGVMFCPGSRCFGEEFKGYVRIGFVNETKILTEGLDELKGFLRDRYQNVPLAA